MWTAVPVALSAQPASVNLAEICSRRYLKESVRIGQYLFQSYSDDDLGACLQVLRNSEVAFRRTLDTPVGYSLGQAAAPQFGIPAVPNGADITGRGLPDMIVSFTTGGAHCCSFHYLFELGSKLKLLATLSDEDDDLAHFAKLGTDKRYYYITADWTFAYWPGSFASSPSHAVVLRWVESKAGGSYQLALDKMRHPAPTPAIWAKDLKAVRRAAAKGGGARGDDCNFVG